MHADVSQAHGPIPATLRNAIAERTVIPFVGAGVSLAVQCQRLRRSLLPSWSELLERAADALERDHLRGPAMVVRGFLAHSAPEYLSAAKHAKEHLGARWTDFLRQEIDISHESAVPETLELARCVWKLGSSLLITTNYDHVLKWACPRPMEYTGLPINSKDALAQLHRGLAITPGHWPRRPTVWHLHGHIDDASELVLAPDGYAQLYSSQECEQGYKAALDTLRHLLLGRTFLFIGFSMDDAAFVQTLAMVNQIYGGCGAQHFAIVRNANAATMAERVRGLPVQLIRFRDFGEPLLALMRELCTCVPDALPPSHAEATTIRELARDLLPSASPASDSVGKVGSSPSLPGHKEHKAVTPLDLPEANTQLAGHFLALTPQAREDIARKLDLLPADFRDLGRIELAKRIFIAAQESKCLAALWAAVENAHPDGTPLPNPYAT